MSLRRAIRIAMTCALLGALSVSSSRGGNAEADSAFEAGDHERALVLYDEVLAADARDVHALVRSAMILSWKRRFGDAVARYERALAREPMNRTAGLERAKVLSWARRYREAIAAFDALLVADPRDREARMGLARSLSWSGRQTRARAEYRKILDASPRDAEALVGVAQTYAWSGEPGPAREHYRRALAVRPGMKEAAVGLAYLDLWAGDRRSAGDRAATIERDHAGDEDVRDLRSALRRADGPWVRSSWDRLDDTDDNLLDVVRLDVGFGLPAGLDLRVGLARYEMSTPNEVAQITSLEGALGATFRGPHRLELRVGADRRRRGDGSHVTGGIGGLSYRFGEEGAGWVRLSADQDTLRYSAPILDDDIVTRTYAARGGAPLGAGIRIEAGASIADFSDDNRRKALDGGLLYRWPVSPSRVETGYVFRYAGFSASGGNAYFDPRRLAAHLVQLRARGPFGSSRFYWDVLLEGGLQSFDRATESASSDKVFDATALVGFPLGRGFALEAVAGRHDYAFTASGFRSTQYGLRFRWAPEN